MISPRIEPPPAKKPKSLGQIVGAESGEICELLHTSLVVQKMHVVEKAGYPTFRFVTGDPVTHKSQPSPGLAAGAFSLLAFVGGAEAQAIFCRRRHQPRRPPIGMKIRPQLSVGLRPLRLRTIHRAENI